MMSRGLCLLHVLLCLRIAWSRSPLLGEGECDGRGHPGPERQREVRPLSRFWQGKCVVGLGFRV